MLTAPLSNMGVVLRDHGLIACVWRRRKESGGEWRRGGRVVEEGREGSGGGREGSGGGREGNNIEHIVMYNPPTMMNIIHLPNLPHHTQPLPHHTQLLPHHTQLLPHHTKPINNYLFEQ